MNEEDTNVLMRLIEPHFDRIEAKIDDHIKHMDQEHQENRQKFRELYDSRNCMDQRITKLETGVMLIKWIIGSILTVAAGGGIVFTMTQL